MTTEPQPPPDEVTERLMHLKGMLADLQNHIERRAEEIATPLIEAAGERAREMVAEAEGAARSQAQRHEDLVAELRRRVAAADRQQEEMRRVRGLLAGALGRHPSTPWQSLVAEIVTRLEESNA